MHDARKKIGFKLQLERCCLIFCWLIVLTIMFSISCSPHAIRDSMNKENGFVSDDFKRVSITPTNNRLAHCEKFKLMYCDEPALQWGTCESDTYWNEEGMVLLSAKAENELLEASYELHSMALEAVDIVVNDDALLDLFYINKDLWPAIRHSWGKG